jgi:pimeloyl-ACP methyl ester carboxylesterase
LSSIDVPSLLIWGREDRVVPLQIGQRLARELKHSALSIIERCGHMPHEERPDEVIAAVKRFNQA